MLTVVYHLYVQRMTDELVAIGRLELSVIILIESSNVIYMLIALQATKSVYAGAAIYRQHLVCQDQDLLCLATTQYQVKEVYTLSLSSCFVARTILIRSCLNGAIFLLFLFLLLAGPNSATEARNTLSQ